MTRHFWGVVAPIVLSLLAIFALGGVGPAHAAQAGGLYHYDFEQGLKPWSASFGANLNLERGDSACPSIGTGSAVLHASPDACCQSDTHPLPVSPVYLSASFPGTGSDTVIVDWAAKAPIYCETGCELLAYVGSTPPSATSAWTTGFSFKGDPQWRNYTYKSGVLNPSLQGGKIFVAVGFMPLVSSQDSFVKGQQSVALDCITVSILPNAK